MRRQLQPLPPNVLAQFDKYNKQWHCLDCHSVDPKKSGAVAPNLTHLADRCMFAGDIFTTDQKNLENWVYNAPSMKPMGNLVQHMPDFEADGMTKDAGRGDRAVHAREHGDRTGAAGGVCIMTTVENAHALVESRPPLRSRILERPKETTGWFSWVTTVDHKKIAIMYGTLALVFFLVGGIEALFIRLQLARPERHGADRGALQRVLHHARHHDGVPHGHAARGGVRELPRCR